jgi:hypothetical protein
VRANPSQAVRQAKVLTHPDRKGDPADFVRVMEAERVLIG